MTDENPQVPTPEWKPVTRLPIQDQMVDVLTKAREVAEMELALLREKLNRMRYGALDGAVEELLHYGTGAGYF